MKTKFNNKEHSDSGLALILMLLLIGVIWKFDLAVKIAVICVLIAMIKPLLFYPFTFIWLNISNVLGKIMSKIILTVIFYLFVAPVGLFRKILGKDSLKLNQFRKSDKSVFIERDHTFTKNDMLNPY